MRCEHVTPTLVIPSSTFYVKLVYILCPIFDMNPTTIVIIFYIILCILKKLKGEQIYIYRVCFIITFLFAISCSFSFLVDLLLIDVCLRKYSFFPTHLFRVVIEKYTTFLYVIGPALQLHNIVLDNCFLN